MTRPKGFGRIVDVDAGILDDDRMVAAIDRVGFAALGAFMAVLVQSWQRGERVTFDLAVDRLRGRVRAQLPDLDELRQVLVDLELLDAKGRLRQAAWADWYEPAQASSVKRAIAGSKGGLAKAANSRASSPASSPAVATGYQTDSQTDDDSKESSVGLSPDAAADPDGPRRRTPPSGPRITQTEHGWTPADVDLDELEDEPRLEQVVQLEYHPPSGTFAERMAANGFDVDKLGRGKPA